VGFEIGDIVYHEATKEQGRIVRCLGEDGSMGYVVTTTNWSGKEIEALWYPGEIKAPGDRAS
jgi:hypothetical protein